MLIINKRSFAFAFMWRKYHVNMMMANIKISITKPKTKFVKVVEEIPRTTLRKDI
jgi:hypothetical protein